ncbi:MAG: hypothetical protein ISR64_04435 [Deltaproteobacteria bacterium]|nr:hypothetical protein [Deltaproteobacteria bacterium]
MKGFATRIQLQGHWLVALTIFLAMGCAHQDSAVKVSPGGRFEFHNNTSETMEVFVDGTRVAPAVEPGESVSLDRLPLGSGTAVAVGKLTGFRASRDITLSLNEATRWRLSANEEHARLLSKLPAGGLRAVNRADEPIRVTIDGEPREMIWPGGEAEYSGVRMGVHRLQAVGVKSGFTMDEEVSVQAGISPVFMVTPPRGGLHVVNRSGVSLVLSLGEITTVRLDPDGFSVIKGLAPGGVPVAAMDLMGRVVWTGDVELKAGEVVRLTVPLPGGVLAVVSDVDEEVSVLADGRRLGECQASGAAEFKGLVPGTTRVQAIRTDGSVAARARLRIPEQGQGVWMIKTGFGAETTGDEGSLLVLNKRDEPIRIRVDGWDRGELAPSGRRLIPALVPGVHAAEAIGLESGELFRSDVEIGIGGTVTWETRPSLATLVLKNLREEEVRVLVDDRDLTILAPGQETELKVQAGRHFLQARGLSTQQSTDHAVELPASMRTRMDLPSPSGQLTVTNRFSEALSISYGNRDLGVVLPGDRVVFRDVLPGTHRLEARSVKRPLSWSVSITLAAGESFQWDLDN